MRIALALLAACAVLAALLFERPHPTPGPPMRDFEAYYAAGAAWLHGDDPYSTAIWRYERTLTGVNAHRYEVLPFVDPPATLPIFSLIARLPFDLANAVWRLLLIICIAGIAFSSLWLARRPPTAVHLLAIAIAALGFGPLTSALALGQLVVPAVLFSALALYAPLTSTLAWLQPNIAIVVLSQFDTRMRFFQRAAGALLFAAACTAVVGVRGIATYLHLIGLHGNAERFSAIQITPAAIAYGFGAPPHVASIIGLLVALVTLTLWALSMRAAGSALERFCLSCAALPLVVPFFHEHDLLVLFIPAIVYTLRTSAGAATFATFGTLFVATDWLGIAQRPDGVLQTMLLVGALGTALVLLRDEEIRLRAFAPAALTLVLIALAGFAAHGNAAPVWPDAMRALPANVQSLGIANAWRDEQSAAGLFAQNMLWAALRLLSLFGCGLVGVAIALARAGSNVDVHHVVERRNPIGMEAS